MTAAQTLAGWVAAARQVTFFGGAGVSTESGIPDFRSADGLYHQQFSLPPEQILSHGYFERHTEEFFRFYRQKMLPQGVQPNAAHRTLAAWEAQGKLNAVVTQNIDGLHQAAGSRRVWELHGSVKRNYCRRCGRFFDEQFILESTGVPRCPCGGVVKPDVVLYDEPLDEAVISGAVAAIEAADLLIVAGTSLTVYPAAGLLRYFRGDRLVLINRDPTPMDERADLLIRERVGEVLGAAFTQATDR